MRLLKSRRFWLPVIAFLLINSIGIAQNAIPLPDGTNFNRTVVYPLMIFVYGTYRTAVPLIFLFLLVWWVIELIRAAHKVWQRMLILVATFASCVLFCGLSIMSIRDNYQRDPVPTPPQPAGIDDVASVRAGDYVYHLAYVPLFHSRPLWATSMAYDVEANWVIYRCDGLGILCHPVYRSNEFQHDASTPIYGLGGSIRFNAAADQIRFASSIRTYRGIEEVSGTLDHASQPELTSEPQAKLA